MALEEKGIVPLYFRCISVRQFSFAQDFGCSKKKVEVYLAHDYRVWQVQEQYQYVTNTKRRPGCCIKTQHLLIQTAKVIREIHFCRRR